MGKPINIASCSEDIPLPIVKLNRGTIVLVVGLGLLFQQPLLTTTLWLILLLAVLFGPRGSLIFQVGKLLFAAQNATAEKEDRNLMRFNNIIAVFLLSAAQLAFITGFTLLGWIFALLVAIAASVALAGFCLGCFLYYQFKINRYRFFLSPQESKKPNS